MRQTPDRLGLCLRFLPKHHPALVLCLRYCLVLCSSLAPKQSPEQLSLFQAAQQACSSPYVEVHVEDRQSSNGQTSRKTRTERCVKYLRVKVLHACSYPSTKNYLGHSINAPTGRWQKNKDVHWYQRDKNQAEEERREELRRIKEAEAEALAAALYVILVLLPSVSFPLHHPAVALVLEGSQAGLPAVQIRAQTRSLFPSGPRPWTARSTQTKKNGGVARHRRRRRSVSRKRRSGQSGGERAGTRRVTMKALGNIIDVHVPAPLTDGTVKGHAHLRVGGSVPWTGMRGAQVSGTVPCLLRRVGERTLAIMMKKRGKGSERWTVVDGRTTLGGKNMARGGGGVEQVVRVFLVYQFCDIPPVLI